MPKCNKCDYPYATKDKCTNCGETNPTGNNYSIFFFAFVILVVVWGIKGANSLGNNQTTAPSTIEESPSTISSDNSNTYQTNEPEAIQYSDTTANNTVQSNGYANEVQSTENTATNEYNGTNANYQQQNEAQIDSLNNYNGSSIYTSNSRQSAHHSSDTTINDTRKQSDAGKTNTPDNEKKDKDERNEMIDAFRQAMKNNNN